MKQGEILFFLGSICVIVFASIVFTVLHNSFTSTINQETIQSINPIDGTFDTTTIKAMQQRPVVLPLFSIQPQNQTIITHTAPSSPSSTSSAQTATGGVK